MAKRNKPTRPARSTPNEPPLTPDALRGELQQLATIRAKFPAVPERDARALLRQHNDERCRSRGEGTRAPKSFTGMMHWARTFGDHAADKVVQAERVRVRWFLDNLTALGTLLAGRSIAGTPAEVSAFDAVERAALKVLEPASRRARNAAAGHDTALASLDKALEPDSAQDPTVKRLNSLAGLLTTWLAEPEDTRLPLSAYGLSAATVTALREAAKELETAIARRPAIKQVDRDSPEINIAEGRLYFILRGLWDDVAEGRKQGETTLMLQVTPTLMRGLELNARKKKSTTDAPADTA